MIITEFGMGSLFKVMGLRGNAVGIFTQAV